MVNDSIAAEISRPVAGSPGIGSGEKEATTPGLDLLHRRLEMEWESLENRLEVAIHPADYGQVGSYHSSGDELASDNLESWKRTALEKRIREQLVEVERALRKFEEGTYGLCDACGQPIAPERLEAIPQANLCISCKTRSGKSKR